MPHRRAGRWVAALSAIAIAAATLTPSSVPLQDLSGPWCVVCGSVGGVDVALNVLLFLPLGVGLAVAGVRASRALAVMAALTLTIECLQLVIPGRDASIGDVLMNVIGGAMGFVVGRHYAQLLWPARARRVARMLALAWTAIWLGIQLVVAYALTPRAPASRYYGQIAPTLAGASVFHGHVSSPAMGGDAIADGELSESQSARLRAALDTGALVQVLVTPTDSAPLLAPILRIADDRQRELMVLGQQGSDVVFGLYTGADMLRLRAVRLRLPDALRAPLATASDSTVLEAMYTPSRAIMRARTGGATREFSRSLRVSDGWRLFAPMQTYVDDSRWSALVGAGWLVLLSLPLGYWGALLRSTRSAHARSTAALSGALLIVVLAAGLCAVPAAFSVPCASARDWAASLAGALLGAGLSAAAQRSRSSPSRIAATSG